MIRKWAAASLAASVVCIVCGIILFFNPGAAALTVMRIVGIAGLVMGGMKLYNIYKAKQANGMLEKGEISQAALYLAAGIALTFWASSILNIVNVAFGILLIIAGVVTLRRTLPISGIGPVWVAALLGAAGIVVGVIMLFGGISAVNTALKIAGIALIVWGVQGLIEQHKH